VRGLQDVAAGIEDDVGRALAPGLRPSSDTRQGLGRQLQPRQNPHPAAHRLKALPPADVEGLVAGLRAGKTAGELHHETRVDPLGASRDAVAAAAAHRGPAHRIGVPGTAGDQIDDAGGGLGRIGLAEPGRRHHRASAKARAAAGAGIGDRLAPRSEILEIPGRFGVVHAVTKLLQAQVIAGRCVEQSRTGRAGRWRGTHTKEFMPLSRIMRAYANLTPAATEARAMLDICASVGARAVDVTWTTSAGDPRRWGAGCGEDASQNRVWNWLPIHWISTGRLACPKQLPPRHIGSINDVPFQDVYEKLAIA